MGGLWTLEDCLIGTTLGATSSGTTEILEGLESIGGLECENSSWECTKLRNSSSDTVILESVGVRENSAETDGRRDDWSRVQCWDGKT